MDLHGLRTEVLELIVVQCIACGKVNFPLAESHVISKFIRNRLTGEESGCNKRFKFSWVGRPDLPNQDLPKPLLMCRACDSDFGGKIEREAPALLMPADADNWLEWGRLPIVAQQLGPVFGSPLNVGVYSYSQSKQRVVERFATLTAWRALHAMAREGSPLSVRFLQSAHGRETDVATREYLLSTENVRVDCYRGGEASLYFLGPASVKITTGQDDEMLFAWAELGDQELLGIGVAFAYWVVLWPVFAPSDDQGKLSKLQKLCFEDWRLQMMQQFRERRSRVGASSSHR